MIQWDREIVEEWDSSIIVRCDRPEDYNKTIRFDLSTLDEAASFISSTHPGMVQYRWVQTRYGAGMGSDTGTERSEYSTHIAGYGSVP